jgi:hypothetical protein
MDFNTINNFMEAYDELSKLNEDSTENSNEDSNDEKVQVQSSTTVKDHTIEPPASKNPQADATDYDAQKARAERQANKELAAEPKSGIAKVKDGLSGTGALAGATALLVSLGAGLANPATAPIIGTAIGAVLATNLIVNTIEKAQYKKVTKDKPHLHALILQDPQLSVEVQQLINKFGKKKVQRILTDFENYLVEHPECLEINKEDLEAGRKQLLQVLQQEGRKEAQ